MSTPIKRTRHSTHTEEKTAGRIIIDAAVIRQKKLLDIPDKLLDVTLDPCELPERFKGLVPEGGRTGEGCVEERGGADLL